MPNGYDKNWVRPCAAIEGFYQRYGHWPKRLLIPDYGLRDLEEFVFTPESMGKIRRRLQLIESEVLFRAEDDDGNSYVYGDEGFPDKPPRVSAEEWLGVSPDRPSNHYY